MSGLSNVETKGKEGRKERTPTRCVVEEERWRLSVDRGVSLVQGNDRTSSFRDFNLDGMRHARDRQSRPNNALERRPNTAKRLWPLFFAMSAGSHAKHIIL